MADGDHPAECFAAIALIIDHSTSVKPWGLKAQYDAHAAVIESSGTLQFLETNGPFAVSLISFGKDAKEIIGWHLIATPEDAQNLASLIRQKRRYASPKGATYVGRAIHAATQSLTGEARQSVCPDHEELNLVIDLSTDGRPSHGGKTTVEAAWNAASTQSETAGNQGISINVLAINIDDWRLRLRLEESITGLAGGRVFPASWPELPNVLDQKFQFELAGNEPPLDIEVSDELPVPRNIIPGYKGQQAKAIQYGAGPG